MFLDEPTSGLDATKSLKVARILQALARLGITIVTVIHQPRKEIFDCIDDVLLLAPGGVTAFCGARQAVISHFEGFGYTFETGCNPADVLLDILSMRPQAVTASYANIKDHFSQQHYRQHQMTPYFQPWLQSDSTPRPLNEVNAAVDQALRHVVRARYAHPLTQVGLAFHRSLQQQYRLVGGTILELIVSMIAGSWHFNVLSKPHTLY